MATPESNRTTPLDQRETLATPRQGATGNEHQTIDLRDTNLTDPASPTSPIDLRETALVPTQGGPSSPPAAPPERPVEVLRFGPGVPAVPAVMAVASAATAAETPVPPRRLRRGQAANLALTLALAAVVIWLLWPAGSLRVRSVSVKATPGVVTCEKTADVVATVHTNGNAGRLTYRWSRNDGIGSGTLVQSLARGQHSVDLHLTWAFHGPGIYDARATVRLLSPRAAGATVNFRYAC